MYSVRIYHYQLNNSFRLQRKGREVPLQYVMRAEGAGEVIEREGMYKGGGGAGLQR